jgi:Fic family protein
MGRYVEISTVGGEICNAFIPDPLPPSPDISIDANLREIIDQSLLALGRLDSISTILPDTSLFLYMYIRKEAVLSSQIEGIQSSLSDLLVYESKESPGVPMDDVREVSNYVAAMEHGLKRIQEGFPLSLRLIKKIHGVLLRKGRGKDKNPGEFKKSQNWIGGTRPGNAVFIPTPPENVMECMGALEKFLHNDPVKIPVLIKAALFHAQFETIHPFLDGNGRLGRLLITLLLCTEGILKDPMLYLSLYFKSNRKQYYNQLQQTRIKGDWESWLSFFMSGVKETATSAVETAQSLFNLFEKDQRTLQSLEKSTGSILRVHKALQQRPVTTIGKLSELTGLSFPTVNAALKILQGEKIVSEITGHERGRLYSYDKYIQILDKGTDPIPKDV